MSDAIHERMVWDAEGGLTILRSQDCEPILNRNAELNAAGVGKRPDGWYVGSIPRILYEKIRNETGINLLRPEGREMLLRLLNDSEYRKLRIVEGKL